MPKLTGAILSGVLTALSMPSFSPVPLGFLAWFWLVPLLFELKRDPSIKSSFTQSLVAVSVGFSMSYLWVVNASISGFLLAVVSGIFVWMVPMSAFHLMRRICGWDTALVALPFTWTFWEWFYHSTEISSSVRLGNSQAEMNWLVQFADLFGVNGVTFWLVTINILIFLLCERVARSRSETNADRTLLRVPALLVSVGFLLPLGYAVYVFNRVEPPTRELTVLGVQPNISPFVDLTSKQTVAVVNRQIDLTEMALAANKPDLIIWHEAAFPFSLSQNEKANKFLTGHVAKWKTPLLTGTFEENDGKTFNASVVLQEARIGNGRIEIKAGDIYAKRRLMPFIERVPYVETFPWLSVLAINMGARPILTPGTEARTLSFETQDGESVQVGTLICYESLYPELAADLVRNGAAFLVSINNEGWFANSHGQSQLATFSRFRSIETRRETVRVGATGMTWITDRFGRIKQQLPAWAEQTMFGTVRLSTERTLYVENPDLLPRICGIAILLLLFVGVGLRVRK